ncbi:MAG: HDIG domain-containing protein [bacterium]|nr:HDIG domain-containing protein [bacterium]
MNREEAWKTVCEFTESDSLRRHALAVEAAMAFYARKFGEDEELWRTVGVIHDFDYERYPDPCDHTVKGAEILRERGVSEEIVGAMMSHADVNEKDYPRDTLLRKTLYAVDEMSGFIMACAYVRPTRLEGMAPSSVKKKMKTASFAAAVSREELQKGAELLGIDLNEHIANVIAALQPAAKELGLS